MITKVTITGADDAIKHKDLLELSNLYPFVEWGVLISDKRLGTDRYPSMDWIKKLCVMKGFYRINTSLHICGNVCKDMLMGIKPNLLYKQPFIVNINPIDYFDRFQLNFNIQTYDMNLKRFMKILSELNNDVIFQYNKSNEDLMKFFIEYGDPSWNYLYDSSGGRGISRGDWKEPINERYTGYAGGLSPDNLKEEIEKILQVSTDKNIWIDVESGVRTDDKFDLEKVAKFLEIAKEYIKKVVV